MSIIFNNQIGLATIIYFFFISIIYIIVIFNSQYIIVLKLFLRMSKLNNCGMLLRKIMFKQQLFNVSNLDQLLELLSKNTQCVCLICFVVFICFQKLCFCVFKPDKSYKIKSIIFLLLGCAFHLSSLLIALLTLFVFKVVDIEKISSFYHFLFGRIKINLFTITTITFLILVPYIIANFEFIIPMEAIIFVYKLVPIIASKMMHYGPGFVYANEDIKFPTMVVFKSLFLFFIPMFFARNIFTIDIGSVHYKYIKNYKYLILIFFMFLICSVLSFVFSGTLSIRILQLSKPLLVFNFAIIINIYRKLNANYKNIIYLMNIINFLLFIQLITRADLGCRTLKCVL